MVLHQHSGIMKLIYFTKPPRCSTVEELIELGNQLGVDGFVLCVRSGYAVTSEKLHGSCRSLSRQCGMTALRYAWSPNLPTWIIPSIRKRRN